MNIIIAKFIQVVNMSHHTVYILLKSLTQITVLRSITSLAIDIILHNDSELSYTTHILHRLVEYTVTYLCHTGLSTA